MRHLLRTSLLVLCIFGSINLSAQGQGPLYLPDATPPSPTVAALGKYGNTPVSLHTGIPQVSIPLYTVKTKRLELPISLSYHASGFRVNDLSPWTGLGWSLLAGGCISRSAVGLGDDGPDGFLVRNNQISATDVDEDDLIYLLTASNGMADNETDYYFYNFNGRSGKFVFNKNKQPVLIPQEPIRIAGGTSSFTITAEDGTIYEFGDRQSVESGFTHSSGSTTNTFTSAYYLTRIRSADGSDEINLYYGHGAPYTEWSYGYTEAIGEKCTGESNPQNGMHDFLPPQQSFRNIQEHYLDSIVFSTGRVVFLRSNDRTDFGPGDRLVSMAVDRKNPSGSYSREKSYRFNPGYLRSGSAYTSRFKLKGLTEQDAQGNDVRTHEFVYNESPLPFINSFSQDWWGFANGRNNNQANTLIQRERMVGPDGMTYVVGGADRRPNEQAMQAGLLNTIQYPTGGYTQFFYEPHYFFGTVRDERDTSVQAGSPTSNPLELQVDVAEFTVSTYGYATVNVQCSDGNTYFSNVTLAKVGGPVLLNFVYDPAVYPGFSAGPDVNKQFDVALEAGATYRLIARAQGASTSSMFNGKAYAKAQVAWTENTPGKEMAGGVRIKEMRDYETAGAVPVTKLYKYGVNEDGLGVLLTPASKLASFKDSKVERYWDNPVEFCNVKCDANRMFIHADPPQSLTSLSGSPVAYTQVTVYEKSVTAPNGKTVFEFDVEENEIFPAASGYRDGVILLDNSWKGGDMISQVDYRGESVRVKETSAVHGVRQTQDIISTKIGKKYSDSGTCGPAYLPNAVYNDFYYFDYPIRSGIKKTASTKEVHYSSTSPLREITTETFYHYDDISSNHQQLSRKISIQSNGDVLQTNYWYPADYADTGEITPLLTKNIINIPLKEQMYLNDQLIDGTVTRFNGDGQPIEVYKYENAIPQMVASHDSTSIVPSGYVKRVDISYDPESKNVSRVSPVDDKSTLYLWSYRNGSPIAKITNADVAQVAATSFEYEGKGNWTFSGTPGSDATAKTGVYSYNLGYGAVSKVLSPGKYKLEYWAKGMVNVSGGTVSTLRTSAPDATGWVLYEKEVTIVTSTTLQISGSSGSFLDEIRVYPNDAQVITFTHDPLKGLTSKTDENNRVTYYGYDSVGRFRSISDHDRNVLKQYEYHYQMESPSQEP